MLQKQMQKERSGDTEVGSEVRSVEVRLAVRRRNGPAQAGHKPSETRPYLFTTLQGDEGALAQE